MRYALVLTLLVPVLGCSGWFAAPCTGGLEHQSSCTGRHTFQLCRPHLLSPQWTWQDDRCPGEQLCTNTTGDSYRLSTCVDALLPEGCPEPGSVCVSDTALRLCKIAASGEGYWRTTGCSHGCGETPIGPGCLPRPVDGDVPLPPAPGAP